MSVASERAPRVLMAQETYLPLIGGAEMHVFYLAQNLIAKGYGVRIITGTPAKGDDDGVIGEVHRFPVTSGLRDLLRFPWWLARFVRLGADCDIVHAHYSAYFAFLAVLVGRLLGKRVVVTLHGLGTLDSSVGRAWTRHMYRRVSIGWADAVVATSQEMRAVALRYARPEAIALIENGVDTRHFTPECPKTFDAVSGHMRLATLRRLVPKNGVQYAVDALGVAGGRLRAELMIIGEGRLRSHIEARISHHRLHDCITMTGALNHREVRDLLEDRDVVVFLSTAESTSLAALECMAMGCLVLCSNAGAFPDFVQDGVTGFVVELFEPGVSDYDAVMTLEDWQYERIVAKLEAIQAMEPAALRQVSHNAMAYVRERYDWSRITSRTIGACYFPAEVAATGDATTPTHP